jgi:hypothetical protein
MRMIVIKSNDQALEMRGYSKKNQNMEHLVGAAPDVKCSRPPTLWNLFLGRHIISITTQ